LNTRIASSSEDMLFVSMCLYLRFVDSVNLARKRGWLCESIIRAVASLLEARNAIS
jgi:hypothetical protein